MEYAQSNYIFAQEPLLETLPPMLDLIADGLPIDHETYPIALNATVRTPTTLARVPVLPDRGTQINTDSTDSSEYIVWPPEGNPGPSFEIAPPQRFPGRFSLRLADPTNPTTPMYVQTEKHPREQYEFEETTNHFWSAELDVHYIPDVTGDV